MYMPIKMWINYLILILDHRRKFSTQSRTNSRFVSLFKLSVWTLRCRLFSSLRFVTWWVKVKSIDALYAMSRSAHKWIYFESHITEASNLNYVLFSCKFSSLSFYLILSTAGPLFSKNWKTVMISINCAFQLPRWQRGRKLSRIEFSFSNKSQQRLFSLLKENYFPCKGGKN